MQYDETDYVYKITVPGTGIREYYNMDELLSESEVADIWLSDAEEKYGSGLVFAFKDRVRVERLTDIDVGREEAELEEEAIPLPPPDNDK